MNQIALGKRIKAAREKACMTQEELAAAVDYSVDHIDLVRIAVFFLYRLGRYRKNTAIRTRSCFTR